MRYYIFLTKEGFTETPNNENIENLQVLGTSKGVNEREAFNSFVKENNYIFDTEFNEVIALELASQKEYYFNLKNYG
ncbi:MAG: hypothetical protein A2231_08730 [Candidatus Firestonebacteria bacterium RIFOXYA2_FULL_40_8]|nr:MAG: hypothetical protein A2231_08730 [Candidatus Firestonebacteria bacterium RIFOXYA2_FULL_40_8]